MKEGAPNEKFTILKWHLEIRIHELIDFLASLPSSTALTSDVVSVADILEINTSNEICNEVVISMKESRKAQPLLVACIQEEDWVIDGNHRLKRKERDGDKYCEVIFVPNKLLYRFCQSFMDNGTERRQKTLMEEIKVLLKV